jgi:tetratricopeptide (TPR) repeat protein
LEEAEPYFRESIEIRRAANHAGSERIAADLSDLAGVQQDLGKTAQARANWDEAVAMLRRGSPNGSAPLARVLWRSAIARLENMDNAAALEELEETVAMAEKVLPADHPQLREYRETLAKCKAAIAGEPVNPDPKEGGG